jgi:opacity protein-like surface antigen
VRAPPGDQVRPALRVATTAHERHGCSAGKACDLADGDTGDTECRRVDRDGDDRSLCGDAFDCGAGFTCVEDPAGESSCLRFCQDEGDCDNPGGVCGVGLVDDAGDPIPGGESIDVLGYRAQAAVDVAKNGPVRAFVVAGAGVLDLLAGGVPTMQDDTDLALHWGGGVAVAASPHLEIRVDGRHLVLPSIGDSGAASDVEVTAGLAYLVGIEP